MKHILPSKMYLALSSQILRGLSVLVLLILTIPAQAQLEELEINSSLTSGIVQDIDSSNQIGMVQFKVEDLDLEKVSIIRSEFQKYAGDIIGFGYSVLDSKIIISYKSPVYPNYLLAILDRSNIVGFYEQGGLIIYYFKDGYSSFIR